MDIRSAAAIIKGSVTMDQVLALYGYQARHGFMVCPFHGDRDASLKVYHGTKGWHCFGCGAGGSVIDFVMMHESCNFVTAVRALDEALGLRLLQAEDPLAMDETRRIRGAIDGFVALMDEQITDVRKLTEEKLIRMTAAVQEIESKPAWDRTGREWGRLSMLDEEMQELEQRLQDCDALRREVRQWRTDSIRSLAGAPSASPQASRARWP
jgi:DNA primase